MQARLAFHQPVSTEARLRELRRFIQNFEREVAVAAVGSKAVVHRDLSKTRLRMEKDLENALHASGGCQDARGGTDPYCAYQQLPAVGKKNKNQKKTTRYGTLKDLSGAGSLKGEGKC